MSKLRDHIKTFDFETLDGFAYLGEYQFEEIEQHIFKTHIEKDLVRKYIFEWEGDTYAIELNNPGLKFAGFNWRSLRRVVPQVIEGPGEPFTVYNEVDP